MLNFRRFPVDQLLDLIREQNSLLRELLAIQGARARTPKAGSERVQRIYTDQDVTRVDRQTVLTQEAEAQEKMVASWRHAGAARVPQTFAQVESQTAPGSTFPDPVTTTNAGRPIISP